MSKPNGRGRPQQDRPPTEAALKEAVRALCLDELHPLLRAAGAPLESTDPEGGIPLSLALLFETPLLRDSVRRQRIERAYSALHVALRLYTEVRPMLGRAPFEESASYLNGINDPNGGAAYSAQWDHLIRLGPWLDRLAEDLETMGHLDFPIHEYFPAPNTRECLLLNLCDEGPAGTYTLRPFGSLGRPLTLREMALMSLAIDHWPELHPGEDTPRSVTAREAENLRKACQKLGIIPPKGGGQLTTAPILPGGGFSCPCRVQNSL